MSSNKPTHDAQPEAVQAQPTPMPADLEAALRDVEALAEGREPQAERPAEEAPERPADEGEPRASASAPASAALVAELEAAKRSADELRDAMLRARADLDNARRRFEREKDESTKYAAEKALKAIVPVVDDLDLTLANIPTDADAKLIEGIQLVHRKFLQALESQGAKSFYPLGERFDPSSHEALMEMPSAEHPEGHIAQVFQRGWNLNDRLLRPAKVIISKGAEG